MKAIDMLNKVPVAAVDYERLFEQQMTELETLKIPNEIIKLFRQKKGSLLRYISENYKAGYIPFIPAISIRAMSFVEQFQRIAAPFTSTGDIHGILNAFFYNEDRARDISGANSQQETYFLVNVNLESCPKTAGGCIDMRKTQDNKGMKIMNHAETLILAHFASNIFSSYERILVPGFSWDDYECAYFFKSRNFAYFCVGWKSSTNNNPKNPTCLGICEERI